MFRCVILVVAALSAAGCEHGSLVQGASSGAGPVLQPKPAPISPAELAAFIRSVTPQPPALTLATQQQTAPTPNRVDDNQDLLNALGEFSRALYSANPAPTDGRLQNQLRDGRNEIVGALITASNARCSSYEIALRNYTSGSTFFLGGTAAVLGGVGGLFTNSTARIFSALSGAVTGVDAEFQKDMLGNLATSVIIPGIEKQRTGIFGEIAARWCKSVSSYPLSLAIADAIRYHGACTLDKGIAAASQTISTSNNQSSSISPDQLRATLASVRAINADMQDDTGAPAKHTKPGRLTTAGATGGGSAGGGDVPASGAQGPASNPASGTTTSPAPLGDTVPLPDCPSLDQDGNALQQSASDNQAKSTTATPPARLRLQ